MRIEELRAKSDEELNSYLLTILREKFNVNMQLSNEQRKKTHIVRQLRRNIARVKTLLTERAIVS